MNVGKTRTLLNSLKLYGVRIMIRKGYERGLPWLEQIEFRQPLHGLAGQVKTWPPALARVQARPIVFQGPLVIITRGSIKKRAWMNPSPFGDDR